jgi:signal peptidase
MDITRAERGRRARGRARRRLALFVAAVPLVAFWLLFLRPQTLGGPAAYIVVRGDSMRPALAPGDLVVARRKASYSVGDVVAYRMPEGEPEAGAMVIHRVVGGSAHSGYATQGDNSDSPDPWRPGSTDVLGTQWIRLPKLGWFLTIARTPLVLASVAAAATVYALLGRSPRKNRASIRQMSSAMRAAARAAAGPPSTSR